MTVGIMRERLRVATSAAHQRLHRHRGLCAAATGEIDIKHYRALLMRLYGFHRAFDAGMGAHAHLACEADPSPRSRLLEIDLAALGVTREGQEALPLCSTLPSLMNEAQALGALYVVEGSALGGVGIARALAPLLEPYDGAGCRFFSNDGGRRLGFWPVLLRRIEALQGDSRQESNAVDAAVAIFQEFEGWMEDWASEPAPDPPGFPEPENRVEG